MTAPTRLVKKTSRDQAYHERPRLAASIATHPASIAEINRRTARIHPSPDPLS
jgi:hypothetical protein